MDNDDNSQSRSQYPPLEKPEFKSSIPPYLTQNLTEHERFLVESLSRIEQQAAWLVSCALSQNRAVIDIDLRVKSVEKWKSMFTGKWGVLATVTIILLPVVLKFVADALLKKL